jgi:hypothetical protein
MCASKETLKRPMLMVHIINYRDSQFLTSVSRQTLEVVLVEIVSTYRIYRFSEPKKSALEKISSLNG